MFGVRLVARWRVGMRASIEKIEFGLSYIDRASITYIYLIGLRIDRLIG